MVFSPTVSEDLISRAVCYKFADIMHLSYLYKYSVKEVMCMLSFSLSILTKEVGHFLFRFSFFVFVLIVFIVVHGDNKVKILKPKEYRQILLLKWKYLCRSLLWGFKQHLSHTDATSGSVLRDEFHLDLSVSLKMKLKLLSQQNCK